jgi:hypothetical protein
MKPNVQLPSFQKSITLDANECVFLKTALSFVYISVPTLTEDEFKTMANIASKLNAEDHPQNN